MFGNFFVVGEIMKMNFNGLNFELIDGRIVLTNCMNMAKCADDNDKAQFNFVEIQIAGENHSAHCGAKQIRSSEWDKLKYISYSHMGNMLVIEQSSKLILVETYFQAYDNCKAVRIWNKITNISDNPVTIEHASSFAFKGIGQRGFNSLNSLYFYRFYNSWHVECQPMRRSFYELGLQSGNERYSMKRISGCNTGSWSTKEELPQGIIEDSETNRFMMFQIESDNSWYYEIGEDEGLYYVNLGGPNTTFNQWSKVINPKERFDTVKVAVACGDGVNEVIGEMTKYRRNIVRHCNPDKKLPVVFNEYMHLSWDNPNEKRTESLINSVAELGVKYYVIDCGWHDECDCRALYKNVGKWMPSSVRYPSGIEKIISKIHSAGMKAGLWIEPEVIGCECLEMEEYYGEECFLSRNGKKIVQSSRMFLDFRKEKVRNYLTSVIDRLVGYGVDYIKFDYNQDAGAGTDRESDSLGDGLMKHCNAYLDWVNCIMDKYPSLVIEACASGGQRMDYKTLSVYSLMSTSDQVNYKKYPYIVGNILSAVLPEQAAVWSYPVESSGIDVYDVGNVESAEYNVPEEQIIMNMVNSMLGRMYLASAVNLLSEEKRALIKEGVEYYESITTAKRRAVPYFPLGFTSFKEEKIASGFVSGKTIYLAVWSLGGDGEIEIPIIDFLIKNVKIAYPSKCMDLLSFSKNKIKLYLGNGYKARFLEIEIQ